MLGSPGPHPIKEIEMATKNPWHRCYLHDDHKFIKDTAPRTSREAFGTDFKHETKDRVVFWSCVVGAAVVLLVSYTTGLI